MQFDPKATKRQLEREILRLMDIITEMRRECQQGDLGSFALEELALNLERDHGYYRIGRDSRTGEFWCRWKWTRGTHIERYQFGSGVTLAIAISACNQNVSEVERGIRNAPMDRGYKGTIRWEESKA